MSKRIKQITAENFNQAVDYAYTLNKKLATFVPARKIIIPTLGIVFALHTAALIIGAILTLVSNHTTITALAGKLPFISGYWNAVFGLFSGFSNVIYIPIILMVLYAFFVPFAICSIEAIIISRCVDFKEPEIKGNLQNQAKLLFKYLDNPPCHNEWIKSLDVWATISSILSTLCILAFWLYFFFTDLSIKGTTFAELTDDNKVLYIFLFLIMGALYFFVHRISFSISNATVKHYYDSFKDWTEFKEEAERFWLSVDRHERNERERKKIEEEKKKLASKSYSSSSSYTHIPLTFDQKLDYINEHFGGYYSFAAIEYIENDSSLSHLDKEDLKIFLRAYGD